MTPFVCDVLIKLLLDKPANGGGVVMVKGLNVVVAVIGVEDNDDVDVSGAKSGDEDITVIGEFLTAEHVVSASDVDVFTCTITDDVVKLPDVPDTVIVAWELRAVELCANEDDTVLETAVKGGTGILPMIIVPADVEVRFTATSTGMVTIVFFAIVRF